MHSEALPKPRICLILKAIIDEQQLCDAEVCNGIHKFRRIGSIGKRKCLHRFGNRCFDPFQAHFHIRQGIFHGQHVEVVVQRAVAADGDAIGQR
jgi:hypothetical protein